jgi:hypothetical protein
MLPTAAPATAPAVCFGIGGISMFSDDCGVSFSCESVLSGMMANILNILIQLQMYFV